MIELSILLMLMLQAPVRTVTLSWEDTKNPTETTYSIYRISGRCSDNPIPPPPTPSPYAKVATNVTAKTYVDSVSIGTYCYYATASLNGLESDPSVTAEVKVKPFPPSSLSAVQQ